MISANPSPHLKASLPRNRGRTHTAASFYIYSTSNHPPPPPWAAPGGVQPRRSGRDHGQQASKQASPPSRSAALRRPSRSRSNLWEKKTSRCDTTPSPSRSKEMSERTVCVRMHAAAHQNEAGALLGGCRRALAWDVLATQRQVAIALGAEARFARPLLGDGRVAAVRACKGGCARPRRAWRCTCRQPCRNRNSQAK
jgi:hypothetical protein